MDASTPAAARTKGLSMGAALLAALAASSCCLGPVVLAALGLGGAGAFAGVAAYRPLLLGATGVLLGVGFFLSYRKPKVQGDACGCERRDARRLPRLLLWVATAVTLLAAAAPPVLAKLSAPGASSQATPSGPVATAAIRVDGIDCEACAAPIRRALVGAGGFNDLELDVPTKMVTVSYVPGPGRPDVYIKAIDELGYEATLSSVSDARKDLP